MMSFWTYDKKIICSPPGADAQKRAKDVAFVKRMRARQQMAMGMKNNKILQPHLRPQVVF